MDIFVANDKVYNSFFHNKGRGQFEETSFDAGVALTENYLKVELAREREPNRIVDLEIGGVVGGGLSEATGSAQQPGSGHGHPIHCTE